MKHGKSLAVNTVLFVASFTIGLMGVELALRFLDLDQRRFRPHVPALQMRDYYVADPDMGVNIRANAPDDTHWFADGSYRVFSNRLGCFDTDEPIPPGYILVIGDSVAWGYTPFEYKWATRLEGLLGRRVVKCGIAGTGPRHQILKAKQVMDRIGHAPELIVWNDNPNDLQDDFAFPSDTVVHGYRVRTAKRIELDTGLIHRYTPEELRVRTERVIAEETGFITWLRMRSAVANLFWRATYRLFYGWTRDDTISHRYSVPLWDMLGETPWVTPVWEQHKSTLGEIRVLAQERGARLLMLVTWPERTNAPPLLERFLSRNEGNYFWITSEMRRRIPEARHARLRWHHDTHWSILGNRLAGAVVAEHILAKGLVAGLDGDARRRTDAALEDALRALDR